MFEWLIGTPYPFARRVIVNTKEGRSFRGVLWQRRADYLVLRDAVLKNPGADPIPVDGEVLIFRADVSFIQVLTVTEVAR
jgi:hypothetical protein